MARTSSKALRSTPERGTPRLALRFFLAIALVTTLAYMPAWHGAPIWDDDAHMTAAALQGTDGLPRIWTELGATQQYYPLTHSLFWLQHQLWGQDTTGYHLVNIALHILSAGLVGLILTRLNAPAPWAVAAVFALHPMQVESVAWISELKNTLSGVFALGATLVYLRFDDSRTSRAYAIASMLFVCALLSKTVTAMVPAGLLGVLWWRHGGLDVRRHLVPLAPWLVTGAAAGLFTAWLERTIIGAAGAAFEYSLIERGLIAGRALVFYATTLLWPAGLAFNYPRWTVSAATWWQYLFPFAVLVCVISAWRWRGATRAPLAGLWWFAALLFPALGFFNVYPFRYSFVADHFQYLAGLGVITLVVGLLATRLPRPAGSQAVLTAVLALPLAFLTWQQSHHYTDATTLYMATLEANPRSSLALTNLAVPKLRGTTGDITEAVTLLTRAVEADPANAEAQSNLGFALTQLGRLDEARPHLDAALRANPRLAGAHNNLGALLQRQGLADEAIVHYGEAVRLDPADVEARINLGTLLRMRGNLADAGPQLDAAEQLDPRRPEPAVQRGLALEQQGDLAGATRAYQAALSRRPTDEAALENLAIVLLRQGAVAEAKGVLRRLLEVAPRHLNGLYTLASALQMLGQPADAIPYYERAIAEAPPERAGELHNDAGVAYAQSGRMREAVAHFAEAVRLRPDLPDARANLARAQGR